MGARVSVSSENRCAPVPAYDGPPSASNVGAPDSRVNVDETSGEGASEAGRTVDGAPTHHCRLCDGETDFGAWTFYNRRPVHRRCLEALCRLMPHWVPHRVGR